LLLVLDNGSVFTKNLIDFLQKLSINFQNKTCEQLNDSEISNFDSFILSGRRKNNSKMNALNSKIIRYAKSNKKPLLGICYGAEILALTLGGTIKRMNESHRGEEKVEILESNPLCSGTISVFESHHFEISKLGDSFTNLGTSKICINELIQFQNYNIFGTQFHPEMTQDGQELIKNFVSL